MGYEKNRIVLYIDREGYVFQSQSFNIDSAKSSSIKKDIYLRPIKTGVSTRLSNIFFDFNSANLTDDSKTELTKVVRFLTKNFGTKITISGHTDDQGSPEYNQALSENRAEAVYDYLINHGINPEKLTYVGFGESRPISEGTDEESRKLNRRIEFVIDE